MSEKEVPGGDGEVRVHDTVGGVVREVRLLFLLIVLKLVRILVVVLLGIFVRNRRMMRLHRMVVN